MDEVMLEHRKAGQAAIKNQLWDKVREKSRNILEVVRAGSVLRNNSPYGVPESHKKVAVPQLLTPDPCSI